MEQIRLIKELRDADIQRGRTGQFIRPRFMVWENVPGAFSSNKGEDFRAVLEETIRIAEPDAPDIPLPAKGKWPLADAWYGDGWSVAYRVLDAQFWGVPQRRRRIALVADFGGHAAPEILFVRQSVCGDIAEGGAPGEETAKAVGVGAGSAIALRMRAGCAGGGKGALLQVEKSGTLGCNNDQTIFCAGFKPHAGANAESIGYAEEKAPTIDTGKPMAVVISINTMAATRGGADDGRMCFGIGEPGDPQFTITAVHSHAVFDARGNGDGKTACTLTGDHQSQVTDYTAIVVEPLPFDTTQITSPINRSHPKYGDPCHPLAASAHPPAIVMTTGQGRSETTYDIAPTMNCNHEQPIVTGVDCRNGIEMQEMSATLQRGGIGVSLNAINPIRVGPQVRRLTPLECERLQGYPDGWTDIGPWTDSTGKLHKESSDSARYKALGNSIALPPWSWVLKRLCACYERVATMASLFDGIGGFPLIWERLNGPGSCLWASEIEEFPIAVTRRRFGGEKETEK